jgi:hypothetical protein
MNYRCPLYRVYEHRPQLSLDLPADASFPRDKAAVLGDTIKGTPVPHDVGKIPSMDLSILNLGTRLRYEVSFRTPPLYPRLRKTAGICYTAQIM